MFVKPDALKECEMWRLCLHFGRFILKYALNKTTIALQLLNLE